MDANNLFGYAMSKFLQASRFKYNKIVQKFFHIQKNT